MTQLKIDYGVEQSSQKMIKKYLKNGSRSLAIREMKIKIILRFHLTPIKRAKINNNYNKTAKMEGIWGEGNLHSLLVGLEIVGATLNISVENSRKAKIRSTT